MPLSANFCRRPPAEAIRAIERCFADPQNHKYKPVQGIPELIDAIEAKLLDENGIRVRPESHVIVSAGGNMAIMRSTVCAARALCTVAKT